MDDVLGCDDYGTECLQCGILRCTLCTDGYYVDVETGSCAGTLKNVEHITSLLKHL